MATILENDLPRKHGLEKYPWSEWMDGKPRQLKRGTDFSNSLVCFRNNAQQFAKRRGLKLVTHIVDNDTIDIQAVPR